MELTKEQKVAQQVIVEAWNNPDFKKELMDSPIHAIKKLTGETVKLPEGADRMKVADQSDASCLYFNIPAEPNMDNVELTDEQLEIVAGGNGQGLPPVDPPIGFIIE